MPPLLLPLLGTIGITGAFATVVANVAVLGLTFAVQAGLSTYQQRLAKKKARKSYQAPTQTIKGSTEPRRRSFGHAGRLGGYLAFAENIGYDAYLVIVYNQGKITDFAEFYLGDKQVLLDADGCVTTSQYRRGGGTVDSRSWVRIEAHRGLDDQPVSALLSAKFPEWTADHRLRGCAYVVIRYTAVPQGQFQNVYSSTMPDLSIVFDAEALYDPRQPAQDIADAATWGFGDNMALAILAKLTSADGMALPPDTIDMAMFREAANRCDDLIPLAVGGAEKRYRGAVTYNFDEPPDQVLDRMLDACGGEFYLTPEGRIGLIVAAPRTPTVELTDDDIVSLDFERGNGLLRQYNTLVPQYVSPAHGWALMDGPFVSDAASVAELGRVIKEQVEYPYVTSCSQAQRLARMDLYDNNPLYTGEAVCALTALKLVGAPLFRLRSARYGLDIVCRCTGLIDDDTATITVKWESPSPERDLWDAAIHEQPAPVVPASTSDDPTLPAPPHSFEFWTETVPDGEETLSTTGARWQAKMRDGQTYDFRWRETGAAEWTRIDGLIDPAAIMVPVVLGTEYEVSARVLTEQGGISSWALALVTPSNHAGGALALPGLTATGVSMAIWVTVTQSLTPHAWYLDFVVVEEAEDADWALAVTRPVPPGGAMEAEVSRDPGRYDVYARARSVADAAISDIVGPVTVVVTHIDSGGGSDGGAA